MNLSDAIDMDNFVLSLREKSSHEIDFDLYLWLRLKMVTHLGNIQNFLVEDTMKEVINEA